MQVRYQAALRPDFYESRVYRTFSLCVTRSKAFSCHVIHRLIGLLALPHDMQMLPVVNEVPQMLIAKVGVFLHHLD